MEAGRGREPLHGITLQRLHVFCAVYERNSITAAAQALGLSQPTVSRHLRDFEAASGLTLFVLERGRVWPTTEADALYSESRFLQDGIARLQTRIGNLREGTGSKLSVMSVGFMVPQYVACATSRLMDRMPKLRVSLDIATASRQLEAIRAGHVDLGIMAGRIATEDVDIWQIGKGRLVALVPKHLPLARRERATLPDIAELQTVDTVTKGPIGRILDEAMRARRLTTDGTIMCHSLMVVPHMADALGRVAIVDEFTARAHPYRSLRVMPLAEQITFPIFAAAQSPSGSRVAADHLVEILQDLLERPEAD